MERETGFAIPKTTEKSVAMMAEIAAWTGDMTMALIIHPQVSGIGTCGAAELLKTTRFFG